MIQISHEEQEEEEEEELENSIKRRISRPKVKYSPIPEINKRRISKKHLIKNNKLSVQRINSGQTKTISTFSDTSASSCSTRENSFLDEEFIGFDVISQKELREQLGKMKPQEFSLPPYMDLRNSLENGTPNDTGQNLEKYIDFFDIPPIAEPNLTDSIQTTSATASQGTIDLVESSRKRVRRPPQQSDEFVYTPVLKQKEFAKKDTPKFSPKAPARKTAKKTIQQKMDSAEPQTQIPPKPSPLKKKFVRKSAIHSPAKDTPELLAQQLPITTTPKVETSPVSMSAGQMDEQLEEPTGIEANILDSLPSTSAQGIASPPKERLKLKLKLPFKKPAVPSVVKRMRHPAQNTDEFIYTPLKKQKELAQKDALKLRQKALHGRRGRPKLIVEPADSNIAAEPQFKEPQIPQKPSQIKRKIIRKPALHPPITQPQKKQLVQHVPMLPKVKMPPALKIPEVPSVQMEFFDKMNQRKQLNPFSFGIRKNEQFKSDYFYREILISEPISADADDEEIDCVGGAPSELECKDDELMRVNPAVEFARAIQKEIAKDPTNSTIDLDQPDSNFESAISERLNAVNSSVKCFLEILLKFILEQRHVDMVSLGIIGGASMFHSLTMKNANRLRESLKLYSKTSQRMIITAHCWLLKTLPTCFTVSYLNILRFVKAAGSNLSDYIVSRSDDKCVAEANTFIRDYIRQKIYEPPMNPNFKPIEGGPVPNASLVLVYPQITTKTRKHIIHAHETLFRQLLPLVVCCVEKVELNFDVDKPITVEECAWMCIWLIRKKVGEIVKRRPNDHIFLAGWGTTCWLNHKVVSTVPGVSGILNFAFPTESACGSRGSIDDDICLTYPSTLFVVGEEAYNVSMEALKKMRKNMIGDTGLIVVGAANHNLLVSPTRLSVERITQFVIQRTIVEYTVQFVKQVVADLGHPKESRELLKPANLPNIYEVDITLIKPPAPPKARKPAAEKNKEKLQQQPTDTQQPSTSAAAYKSTARPTQIASRLPAHLQPVIPASSTRCGTLLHSQTARPSFSGGPMKSAAKPAAAKITVMGGGIKVPSPETLNSQVLNASGMVKMSAPSTSAASMTLQDTLREEEEAAAALSFLK